MAGAILATTTVPAWLGEAGLPIGNALMTGALEFVGPKERDGWAPAERIVPITYVGWPIALGIGLAL